MKIRVYLIKQTQVCGDCGGEGVITIMGFDHGHGHSQEPTTETCETCDGEGIVEVERDIKISITPKKRRK